jgi:subtilisin family serine protease
VIAAYPLTVGGVAGLAPEAKLLSIRVTDAGGTADPISIAEGIEFAIAHRASVINVSYSMPVDNPQLAAAVRQARLAGIPVVAAAGNLGDHGNPIEYPAALPGVIAVGGSTRSGGPWAGSETGGYTLLAAPAEGIRSTASGGGYITADGTSYSAPFVSAAIALVRARYPGESLAQQLHRLTSTAKPLARPVPNDVGGYGIVDPLAALMAPSPPATVSMPLRAGTSSRVAAPGKGSSHGFSLPTALIIAVVSVLVLGGAVTGAVLLRRRRSRRVAVSVQRRRR